MMKDKPKYPNKEDKEAMIKLAKREIKEWEDFLSELKKNDVDNDK